MTSTPITTADIAKGKIDDALSVREKIGYGLGDAGGTVITCLIMNFSHLFLHRRFWINSGSGWHAVYCTARV
ncbi:permease [Escherichia coli]|nr:permease [Escherichia coli]